jgi:hypothetical protein
MSPSAKRPIRIPSLLFGTVVILSTINRETTFKPFCSGDYGRKPRPVVIVQDDRFDAMASARLHQQTDQWRLGWIAGEGTCGHAPATVQTSPRFIS